MATSIVHARGSGTSFPEDADHPLANLGSLLTEDVAFDPEPVRSPGVFIRSVAASVIPFGAGIVLAHDVAVRTVAWLHDPEVSSPIAPVLAGFLDVNVDSPGTLPPEESPDFKPDTYSPPPVPDARRGARQIPRRHRLAVARPEPTSMLLHPHPFRDRQVPGGTVQNHHIPGDIMDLHITHHHDHAVVVFAGDVDRLNCRTLLDSIGAAVDYYGYQVVEIQVESPGGNGRPFRQLLDGLDAYRAQGCALPYRRPFERVERRRDPGRLGG